MGQSVVTLYTNRWIYCFGGHKNFCKLILFNLEYIVIIYSLVLVLHLSNWLFIHESLLIPHGIRLLKVEFQLTQLNGADAWCLMVDACTTILWWMQYHVLCKNRNIISPLNSRQLRKLFYWRFHVGFDVVMHFFARWMRI